MDKVVPLKTFTRQQKDLEMDHSLLSYMLLGTGLVGPVPSCFLFYFYLH